MALYLLKWLLLFMLPSAGMLQTFSKPHAHPFYVSVVEVAHNKTTATLEVSCKLFAEDAEAVLERNYKTGIDFNDLKQSKRTGELVNDYIQKHLLVSADKKAATLHYLGFELEAESLYCYFEAAVPAVKTIELTNSLLYDFSDKQINIMHVSVGGTRKSAKLDYPAAAASFAF